jgi:autotransporter-associated beta strand protein
MNASGSGQFNSNYRITLAANAGSTGILNIGAVGSGGGTVTANWLQVGAGTAIVNFHGGTLKANSSQTYDNTEGVATDKGLIGLDSYIYGEGAIIDTAGYSVKISKNLLTPAGKGVQSANLTANGAGYVAPPVVKITGGSGTGATANAVVNTTTGQVTGIVITNPGTGYGASDTLTVTFIGGGCTTPATATITPTNLVNNVATGSLTKNGLGTLTLTGSFSYGGPTVINTGTLAINNGAANTLHAISGAGSLSVLGTSSLTATSINVDTLTIGGTGGAASPIVNTVPEPGTLVLLALAGMGVLLAAWRKK